MKRIIEIDEDMFNVLRKAEDMDCEISAEARMITKSIPLNAVLNTIIVEILLSKDRRIDNNTYITYINTSSVMDIIEKYTDKEYKNNAT